MKDTPRLAVIPARGGSTRIPNKNIRPFAGRPLIAWTIDAAVASGLFDRVLVSTDDQDIAAAARDRGLDVPFLRREHADSVAPVSLATATAAEQASAVWGERYAMVVQLLPTCPLRTATHLRAALEAFQAWGGPFQLSCARAVLDDPWWALQPTDQGFTPLFPDALTSRSQDLPELRKPTGAVWVAHFDALVEQRTFYGRGYRWHELPWEAGIDIDTAEQWELAEALAAMRAGGSTVTDP